MGVGVLKPRSSKTLRISEEIPRFEKPDVWSLGESFIYRGLPGNLFSKVGGENIFS